MTKKAFLEIDMPESCMECPLGGHWSQYLKGKCGAEYHYVSCDSYSSAPRPPYCPLKEKEEDNCFACEAKLLEASRNKILALKKINSGWATTAEKLKAENEKLQTQLRRAHNIWLEIEQAVRS